MFPTTQSVNWTTRFITLLTVIKLKRIGQTTSFLFLLLILATGCKKDKDEPEPLKPLVANAGPDQSVQVGQLVTLDGSGSADGEGKPITYQWALTQKPAKSTVILTNANAVRATFTPDEVGDYELSLTISNGSATSVDQVKITASVAQPISINSDITVKTVLENRIMNPDLPDYIVTKSIAVKHELTIQPGVVIAFERDARFDINDKGGMLVAQGTPEQKIRFIGVNPVKGYWAGIMLYSASNANLMANVEVLHAGSRPMLDNKKMGMSMFKESQIALKNTIFAQHDGYGLFIQEGAIVRDFSANTFSNNTEAGLLLSTENVTKLDAASVFTASNGRNVVEINGEYIGDPNSTITEITWHGFTDKTPYRLLNSVAVRSGWRLLPGVTVEVARDASITINEQGYIAAKGTTDQRVIFTGAASTKAYWQGILSHSTSHLNSIENVDIQNAGSKVIISGQRANLALYGSNATMTIRHTRISGSGGHGILVGYGSSINDDASTSNQFDNNTLSTIEYEQ